MSLLRPFSWPLSLPPLLSTALNVGVAIGGYTMAIPFYEPGIPGPMIGTWFSRFFRPGFISVMVLGITTLVTGFRAWRGLQPAASRHAALGLLFTFMHFGFGPLKLHEFSNNGRRPNHTHKPMGIIRLEIFYTGHVIDLNPDSSSTALAMGRLISTKEIVKHNIPEDLWIVVDDNVYDMTEFAPQHPGGAEIIHGYAGRDATQSYSAVHAPSLIQTTLPSSAYLGTLDTSSLTTDWVKPPPPVSASLSPSKRPPLDSLINTYDFVSSARISLTPKTWAFYSSAATDLHTKHRNTSAYTDIGLRPRALINVKNVSTKTSVLGSRMDMPIFCAPAAMARMVYPEGERALAQGCRKKGIPQCVSTNASFPIAEIFSAVSQPGYYGDEPGELPVWFQLYVDKQREKSEALLRHVEKLGVKAIFVTVDAPVPGKREADERVKADEGLSTPMSGATAKNDSKGGALGRIMGGFIDASLAWSDIPWLRRITKLPIVLKGIQNFMDAKKAMELGIEGIVLSNHGGRSLDTAPPPILVLLEIQRNCPEVLDKMEVMLDGGVMRGTDIFKALCLGAKAVGIGRGFLYALNYGEEGVRKYVDSELTFAIVLRDPTNSHSVLKDELETTMRMMGITDLSQVHPGFLNTKAVDHLIPDGGDDHPYAKWRPRSLI
ncbi:hypothetical protein B7494_g369 [Chlorociboria aeruginascens]|nr:hypothetical protein B7494_g369 [Chlorociboria aeruginascens]